jgi:hypothetical protein
VLILAGLSGLGAVYAIHLMTASVATWFGEANESMLVIGAVLLVVCASLHHWALHRARVLWTVGAGVAGIALALGLTINVVEPGLAAILESTYETERLLMHSSLLYGEMLVVLGVALGVLTLPFAAVRIGRALAGGVLALVLVLTLELLRVGREGMTVVQSPDLVLSLIYGPLAWMVIAALAGPRQRNAPLSS